MVRPLVYAAFLVSSFAVLGASTGIVMFLTTDATFDVAQLATLLFVTMFVASVMGAQMYRRDLAGSAVVGGLAGAAGVQAFFAAPFYYLTRVGYGAPDPVVLGTFLLVAPLVAGGMSCAGTLVLADGVRRYRAKHGLAHAPPASAVGPDRPAAGREP